MKNRTPRTPLLASIIELIGKSSADSETKYSRRDFLKKTGSSIIAAAAAPSIFSRIAVSKEAPKVVIIGGGIAGLNAAYNLRQVGIIAQIYEGSSRIGGRIFTVKDALAQGLTTEFGGEFIDSSHKEMISLAQQFDLELKDREVTSLKKRSYYFENRFHPETEVIEAIKPHLERIRSDAASLPESIDFENPGNALYFDSISLAQYFDKLRIDGWLRSLLDVAFATEFGLELTQQSALNFLTMFSPDVSNGFKLFGSSDERYCVLGGNSKFTEALASRLPDQINVSHKLEAIGSKGNRYTLSLRSAGSAKEITADIVLLAIPFSILRNIPLKTELPQWKQRAINELGYGSHTKVMAGFSKRIWNDAGYTGEVFGDKSFQLAWDNSQIQSGPSGGMTSFTGAGQAKNAAEGTVGSQGETFVGQLENIFPGISKASNGNYRRFDWTNYEFTQGSYASYKVGQWTSIRGAERKPVGNLFFAGEHCSLDFQGYMNGGAETGRKAAEDIIAKIK